MHTLQSTGAGTSSPSWARQGDAIFPILLNRIRYKRPYKELKMRSTKILVFLCLLSCAHGMLAMEREEQSARVDADLGRGRAPMKLVKKRTDTATKPIMLYEEAGNPLAQHIENMRLTKDGDQREEWQKEVFELIEKSPELINKQLSISLRTPLIAAACGNFIGIAKKLLDKNANPDIGDSDKRTPLSWACDEGFADMARLLLGARANPRLKEEVCGYTPLHIALQKGAIGAMNILLAYDHTLVHEMNEFKETPLEIGLYTAYSIKQEAVHLDLRYGEEPGKFLDFPSERLNEESREYQQHLKHLLNVPDAFKKQFADLIATHGCIYIIDNSTQLPWVYQPTINTLAKFISHFLSTALILEQKSPGIFVNAVKTLYSELVRSKKFDPESLALLAQAGCPQDKCGKCVKIHSEPQFFDVMTSSLFCAQNNTLTIHEKKVLGATLTREAIWRQYQKLPTSGWDAKFIFTNSDIQCTGHAI